MDAADPAPEPKRKLGALWMVTIIVAVIAMMLAAGYGLWWSRASAELEAQLEKIRAYGEPVWYADLKPQPVDPEQDGGPLLLAALEKLQQPDEVFYTVYDAAWGETGRGGPAPPRDIAPGPGDHPEFRRALAANQEALALLRQAIAKPYCRFPRDYSEMDFGATIDGVQETRTLSRLLAADALQSLGTGDDERALEAIDEGLGLSYCLREDPILGAQLVRMVHALLALNALEYALAEVDLSPEQFAALDARLAALEATGRLKPVIIAERATTLTSIGELNKQVGVGAFLVRPVRTEEQAFILEVMTQMAENVDTPGPAGAERQQEIQQTVDAAPARYTLVRMLLPSVSTARSAGLRFRQRLTNARLALRVDRYRAEHGKLPEKLDDVLDESLARLPAGNFSGKPLVYHRQGDGFAIYAPGSNGTDDGGAMQPDEEEGGTAMTVQYAGRGGSDH